MTITLDGPKFGTNNGTTDLIELCWNFYHIEVTFSFRPRTLVSRVGQKNLAEYTIRQPSIHSARGGMPGEDFAPALEASSNPIPTLNET